MAAHEPGILAVATVRNLPDVRVLRLGGGSPYGWVSAEQVEGLFYHHDGQVTEVRPLAVLDLEHPDLIVRSLRGAASNDNHNAMVLYGIADQIAAQTKPPVTWAPGDKVRYVLPHDASAATYGLDNVWRVRSEDEHLCIAVQVMIDGNLRVWDTVSNDWFVADHESFVAVQS